MEGDAKEEDIVENDATAEDTRDDEVAKDELAAVDGLPCCETLLTADEL